MIVTGPCFLPDDKVTCEFQDIRTVNGVYINEEQILCVTPVMKNVGAVKVIVTINSGDKMLDTDFFAGQFF